MGQNISADEYNIFRQFLQDACGIVLGDNKQYLVSSRLRKVAQDEGLNDVGELIRTLNSKPFSTFKERVVDAMTTNETLWFRDVHPFDILKNRLLPEFVKENRGKQLRIWSAASSSGQEAYSISMSIDEFKRSNMGGLSGGEKITGTDISPSMLEMARSGHYDPLSLGRGLSEERKRVFFDHDKDGHWYVKPQIKQRADFRQLNLQDSFGALGKFDIVFCRNVLIYFSAEFKADILTRIHATLNPGGYLFLGSTEALSGLPDLYEMIQCRPGILYRAK